MTFRWPRFGRTTVILPPPILGIIPNHDGMTPADLHAALTEPSENIGELEQAMSTPAVTPNPAPTQNASSAPQKHNILGELFTGISKAEAFVLSIFTSTQKWVSVLSKVGPGTLAAIVAVGYDAFQTALAALGAAEDAASANWAGTITLSASTKALVVKVVADYKTAKADVVEDFKQLGITK